MLLLVKTLVGIAFQLAFFSALMFAPIRSFDWAETFVWLQVYAFIAIVSGIYLVVSRPGAVEARMRAGRDAQTPADRLALSLMVASMMVPIIVAALDVFSWQLLPPPGAVVQSVDMAIFLVGFALVLLAMMHNEFTAPTVHIQQGEEHVLADGGIYAYLRHPMYTGFLLFTAGTTLWLASYAATVLAVVMLVASTIYRIGVEETTLRAELPGYSDYTQRVKTRFLPFIF